MKSVLDPVANALRERMTISRQPLLIGRRPTLLDRLHRGFVRTMFGTTVLAVALCSVFSFGYIFPSKEPAVEAAASTADQKPPDAEKNA